MVIAPQTPSPALSRVRMANQPADPPQPSTTVTLGGKRASDLYPRQHRGDGAVRRHLATRSQRRDLRDDGDQWPQFGQQPFQWPGRRRAEPLPHGRRQLFAILDPAVRRDRRRVGVRPEQPAARRAGHRRVAAHHDRQRHAGRREAGRQRRRHCRGHRRQRASCRKTSAWPSPAWPSPSRTRSTAWARCRRLAVAGLAKFDSSCWPRCRWKPPSPPRFGHGLDQLQADAAQR